MAANIKKISKRLVVNLIRSLKILDARLFKSQLSKPDIYVLNKFSDMDYFELVLENDEYMIFKRKDDFFINYLEDNQVVNLLKCFNATSYFVIDKVNTGICIILQDVRRIIVNQANQNVVIKNDNLLNRINSNLREFYYSYIKQKQHMINEM